MTDTKEKVKVYIKYLEAYLSIMGNLPRIHEVRIYEPFAGSGTDGPYAGSVDAAIEVMKNTKKVNPAYSRKKISYYINDKDPRKYEELKSKYSLDGENNFINISTGTAKDFIAHNIKELHGKRSVATLWFIDPYGYTQVDKSDIEKIFVDKNFRDIIICIPTKFITRFIGKESETHKDKTPQPIKNFLVDWGFKLEDAKCEIENSSLGELIVRNLHDQYPSFWFKSYDLSFNNSVNHFSLLFITSYILGADKFLEATEQAYSATRSDLFKEQKPINKEGKIEKFKQEIGGETISNLDLYEWGIANDLRSGDMNDLIDDLIVNHGLQRNVHPLNNSGKIKKDSNYIGHHYHQDKVYKTQYVFKTDR